MIRLYTCACRVSMGFLPIDLSLALGGEAFFLKVLDHVLRVRLVTDLEQHLDPNSSQRREPHRAAMEDLDDVAAGLGDRGKSTGEGTRAIHHEHFQHYIAALTDEHLLENACEKIGVDVAA